MGTRGSHFRWVVSVLGLLVGCGCDGVSQPTPGHIATSVPSQAVNDGTVAVIRIRLKDDPSAEQTSGISDWLSAQGQNANKGIWLAKNLRDVGVTTVLIGVPSDERFLEDVGMYVGGTPGLAQEKVEGALVRTGGIAIGVGAAALTVVPVGNGWYYIGLNGDGVIDGASTSVAASFSDLLALVGDRPAAIVFPVSDLEESVSVVTFPNQSRLFRRIRALTESVDEAIGWAGTLSPASTPELLVFFSDPTSAQAFSASVTAIRNDMELAVQGSLEQQEISPQEAEADLRFIRQFDVQVQGNTARLVVPGM